MKTNIHNVKQGTQEWHELRDNSFTASNAPAMKGESKFKSRTKLMQELKFGLKETITDYKQKIFDKGHAAEDAAREIIELETFEDFAPAVGSVELDGMVLLASLDGLSLDSNVVWEHKLWNETLAENVRNKTLEPMYYWQLEHQLLVFGLDKALFTVSDGTSNNFETMEYNSHPDRRKELIAGWKQFAEDMKTFEMEAKQEIVVAEKCSIPMIQCSVNGSQITTNISNCLVEVKALAEVEMSRELDTDQDFANKDQLNRDVKAARSELKNRVAEIKGKFVSYSEFESIAQDMDDVLQMMQSHGEKQVKKAKEAKKKAIKDAGEKLLSDLACQCEAQIKPMSLTRIANLTMPDFDLAMKNKRTIESLKSAVDGEVAKAKIEINAVMDRVLPNLKYLVEHDEGYTFLFNDIEQFVNQESEPFQAIVKSRISEHKTKEEEKLEAQREEMRVEEERKATLKAENAVKANELIKSWKTATEDALKTETSWDASAPLSWLKGSNVDESILGDRLDEAFGIYDDCLNKINAHVIDLAKKELDEEAKLKPQQETQKPQQLDPQPKQESDPQAVLNSMGRASDLAPKAQEHVPATLRQDLEAWYFKFGITEEAFNFLADTLVNHGVNL